MSTAAPKVAGRVHARTYAGAPAKFFRQMRAPKFPPPPSSVWPPVHQLETVYQAMDLIQAYRCASETKTSEFAMRCTRTLRMLRALKHEIRRRAMADAKAQRRYYHASEKSYSHTL